MNSVNLVGRLTRDPELRNTTTGKTVASFGIAVQKRFKPQDGSPDADFFNVSAWGQTAEFCANYLTKGRLVSISGRLQQSSYEKDGRKVDKVEVVADTVQGLDRPKDDAQPMAAPVEEYDPFAEE